MAPRIARIVFTVVLTALILAGIRTPARAMGAEELYEKHAAYLSPIVAKYYKGDKAAFMKKLSALMDRFAAVKKRSKATAPVMIKVGTLAPEDTAWVVPVREFLIPILSEISGGAMGITLFPGGVMGEDKDILRKMKMGQLHGCGCTAQGVFSAAPELSVFSLPFLLKNYNEVDHVLAVFRKDINTILAKNGLILQSLIDTGFFNLYSTNRTPDLEEMRKQKVNTWFGEIETTLFNELSITPIPIPVPETLSALRTGIINATVAPASWILGTQAFSEVKYYVDPPFFYSLAAILLDRKALRAEGVRAGLTEKDSDELTQASLDLVTVTYFEEYWKNRIRVYETDALKAFKDYGVKIVPLNPADAAAVEEAGKRVWPKLAGTVYSKEFLARVEKAVEDYRKIKK